MALHRDSPVGAESAHPPGYVQSSDPGAVGAHKVWVDTTAGTGAYVYKIRNAANSAWETVGSGGGGSAITAKDEGSTLTAAATSFDFAGDGVTATSVGGAVTVTIPGAASGGNPPLWSTQSGADAVFASFADGDPIQAATEVLNTTTGAAGPTPSNIGTSLARAMYFALPRTLAVASANFFAVGSTTGLYKFAIYRASDGAQMWESGAVTTVANAWLTVTAGTPFTLAAGTTYLWCVTVTSTGATAGFRSPLPPIVAATFGLDDTPIGGGDIGMPAFATFAVTAGAFPGTLPTLTAAAMGSATGTVPVAWLKGTAS